MNTYLLIDGTNNFIRCYCAIPSLNGNGEPFGGVTGFLWSIKNYIEKCKPTHVVVVFDGAGGSKKRRKLVSTYKEGRKPQRLNRNYDFENIDQDKNKLYQRIRLSDYLDDLPVYQICIDDIEADDVIGFLCFMFDKDRKVIISGDKDFYQLLNDKTIIYAPIKKTFITSKDCLHEYNIHPNNFALAKAIVGDKSDNLKGVKGIGFKKAIKFFPHLANKEKIDINQLFNECEKDEEKYRSILESRQIVIKNLEIMQLENPIISSQSVNKIKNVLDGNIELNLTSFRLKMMQDCISNFNDDFFTPFKFLYYINKENKK